MKVYLGDGVYAADDHGGIVLTTENGIETTNTVYLEREVFAELTRFARIMWKAPTLAGGQGE